MSACVPSLNPLYTDKDVIFDPALIGVWGEVNEKEVWSFEKAGEKKYLLKQTDENGLAARFEVHLVKLQKHLFLDLYLVNPDPEKNDKMKMNPWAFWSLVPGHLFMKVSQISPNLQIALPDPDWLKKFLAKDPKAIRHRKIYQNPESEDDYMICLTAETKELQEFILKQADTKDAFGNPTDLKRRKAGADGGKVEKNN